MISFQKNLLMLPSNATVCGRIFAGTVESIAGVSSFVTIITPCRRLHFDMTVEAPQVIGTFESRYIQMVSIRISLHLPDMFHGKRRLSMAIIASRGGCSFTIEMAPGALLILNVLSEAVMVADRTVIRDIHMLFVIKINPSVKVGQGIYQHGRWWPST